MGDARINRQKWADLIAKLLAEEANGNKTKLGQLLDVNRRTITRWIEQIGDVSEENVREVARRLHLPARTLLLEVGYYDATELGAAEPGESLADVSATEEPALTVISEAALTPAIKRDLLARLERMRARHAEERATAIRELVDAYAHNARIRRSS